LPSGYKPESPTINRGTSVDQDTVSILTVTLNRYDLLRECLAPSLDRAGHPYELLAWDNGSTDKRVIEHVMGLRPKYFRDYGSNLGITQAMNQLLIRSGRNYVCRIDPDMLLPNDWLAHLVDCNKAIPESGVECVHCVQGYPAEVELHGKKVMVNNEVFGPTFFNRRVLNAIGSLCQDYGRYGLEDCDLCFRAHSLGFVNYYVGGLECQHLGEDCMETNAYRMQKWHDLHAAVPVYELNRVRYAETKNYYIAPPEAV
jgi:glycosyltransferase involved in cell wall biosynthesis